MTTDPVTTTDPLAGTGREVLVPMTGELISLDSATDVLAEAVLRVRELEQELYRARTTVNAELVRRLDHENLRKADVGEYTLTVDAPNGVDWDVKQLEAVLLNLVDHNDLSAEAVDRILPLKRSVSLRELKKLTGTLDDQASARVDACSQPSRKARRVKVDHAA